jgi:hypothetical protein
MTGARDYCFEAPCPPQISFFLKRTQFRIHSSRSPCPSDPTLRCLSKASNDSNDLTGLRLFTTLGANTFGCQLNGILKKVVFLPKI